MNEIQNFDQYGLKKKFLDCLEDAGGDQEEACYRMELPEKTLKRMEETDELFADAVQQVKDEVATAGGDPDDTPSRVVGIRPYDLAAAINSRFLQDQERGGSSRHIQLETAKRMCAFLNFYRQMSWNTREACKLAHIPNNKLYRWKRTYPEFCELLEAAEVESITEIYDMARKRALDESASGDAMRSFILQRMGHVVGMRNSNAPTVEVNIKNTPQHSDAIVRAHEKALEASMNVIDVTANDR